MAETDKRKMRMFFKKLSNFLAIFIGIIALFVFGSLLPFETYSLHIVESGSMSPVIRTGSVIVTIPRGEYRVDDVVTFMGTERSGTPVTHRISRTEERDGRTVFFTKGDVNEREDFRAIDREEIMGKAILTFPYAGYLASFMQTRTGFLTLVIIPLAIVGVLELVSGIRQFRREKSK